MAVRTAYRPVPDAGPIERALRAVVALMLVVAVLAAALIAGYEYGIRQAPSHREVARDQSAAIHSAVQTAVKARERRDYALHLKIMGWALAKQRRRLNAQFQQRLISQQQADGEAAARAFRRGQKAGAARAAAKAARAPGAAASTP